jgi:hypothetical protein
MGEVSQGRFGVYILSGLAAKGVYAQWLPRGFQKMAKGAAKTIRQNAQWRKAVLGRMARRKVN